MEPNKELTACFTGHRKIAPQDLATVKQRLQEQIENLIEKGVKTFLCGGAIGFDMLAGQTILGLKEKYPAIKLVLVLPCRNQDEEWGDADKTSYRKLLSAAAASFYVAEEYSKSCMKNRNQRLVDDGDYCIAYMTNSGRSGTAQTVRMAQKKPIPVFNLANNPTTNTTI